MITVYCKKGRCYCDCYPTECNGCKYNTQKPELDYWIKPFIDSINERFKQCGKQ